MTAMQPVTGQHCIVELLDCDRSALDDEAALRSALLEACQAAGATVVGTQSHRFAPHGVTAVVLLAESHMSIHTWPEHGYAAVDIFTCGTTMRPDRAIELIRSRVAAGRITTRTVERGSDVST